MTFRKCTLAAALVAALTGGMALTAQARPGDFHHGPRGPRPCQEAVYQALTPEKQAQYDAIMRDFTEKTAPLRDKLSAKYIEVRTLGQSPTPDPKAVGKATEDRWLCATSSPRNVRPWSSVSPTKWASTSSTAGREATDAPGICLVPVPSPAWPSCRKDRRPMPPRYNKQAPPPVVG
ncbi:MAG: periplasmic heavy metal sensor [Bilophila sp.]